MNINWFCFICWKADIDKYVQAKEVYNTWRVLLAFSFISMAVARLVQDPSEVSELNYAISLICTQFQIGFFKAID